MQAKLAPQLARFLKRQSADQIERQRRSGQSRSDVGGELSLEPGDLISDGHVESSFNE